MRVAFRADASAEIGTGHIMRCLTLADALQNEGARCHFICRFIPQSLAELVEKKGHSLTHLPVGVPFQQRQDDVSHASWLGTAWEVDAVDTQRVTNQFQPDWIVLDHYALDARWEQQVLPEACKLLVIDDLFDRAHVADVLLDQNVGREQETYKQLVPETCRILTGPRFALLRPEFATARPASLARRKNPELKNILITMGGADKDNVSGWLLDCLYALPEFSKLNVTVVLGASAVHADAVKKQAITLDVTVLQNVENMAELMSAADLCIGAAGSTSWERACLGVPSIIFSLADNQETLSRIIDEMGVAKLVSKLDVSEFTAAFHYLSRTENLQKSSDVAANLVDGYGTESVSKLVVCQAQ
ncbi:UDP-2,4-diacetamido-2,4,6-trideoxy-beta-L-altropyranose hydrolase [Pseudovibrio sp. JE062]|uniref:UDP-2,4-diacetamido-2,4, 6-trideoxy-beta-L-altropyranose hydrolase n=1 Tax=Pseudovibrio sp. JE062 TaxID=439495 RepID=UPI000186F65A|nr:UDP-2,4-diacetamido-2,4,6-trideoxy-beta-L-altropyranose hydrolase [Pseudovibrio sp. JE062]EEA93369.1 surface polysaccharide biosynthesis protein, transferase [Pseudovibrio sp. JE062]